MQEQLGDYLQVFFIFQQMTIAKFTPDDLDLLFQGKNK